jgi:hypothetical protein
MGSEIRRAESGKRLRDFRVRVGLGIREVERRSQRLAEIRANSDYLVSHSWIRSVELGEFTPGIFKLYSLSVLYHRGYEELLAAYGIHVTDVAKDQAMFGWPATHVVGTSSDTDVSDMPVPVRVRQEFESEKTNLLTRLVQVWGDIPVALIRQLDVRKSLYGYIGLKDFTLHPVILPGSFVQIDPKQTKVKTSASRRELDRPIYFIELRDAYACGWCELKDGQLSVVPHVNSPQEIRRFSYPHEAEIIGRVTGVAMRISNGGLSPFSELPDAVRNTLEK